MPYLARSGGNIGAAVRRPHLRAAVCLAGDPAGHSRWRPAMPQAMSILARLHRGRLPAAARDRADADHLSLSAADHAGDALRGGMLGSARPSFASAAAGADLCLNLAGMTARLPRCSHSAGRPRPGACRSSEFCSSSAFAGDLSRRSGCRASRPEGKRRGRPYLLLPRWGPQRPLSSMERSRAVRRHHHRNLPAGRCAVGAVFADHLSQLPDRRDRNRDRHCTAAGDVAAAVRRRRTPGDRPRSADTFDFHATAVLGAVRGGVPAVAAIRSCARCSARGALLQGSDAAACAARRRGLCGRS